MKPTLADTDHESTALVCRLPGHCRIKLIGLGGVGCIVLQYLGVFLKSLAIPARLVLIDGDRFEPANEQRMIFHEVGNKAEVKAVETLAMLGSSEIGIVPVPYNVAPDNVAELIKPGDHVLLCVDNHATRKLVSDHCETLDNITLVSGGNDGVDPPKEWGTYGNVQVMICRKGAPITASLARFHPEIAAPDGPLPTVHCTGMVASTPQILFANLAVASALLNAFFAYTCGQLTYQEVKFDILEARMLPQLPLPKGAVPLPIAAA